MCLAAGCDAPPGRGGPLCADCERELAGQSAPDVEPQPLTKTLRFTLPLPPNRANNRYGHWGVRKRHKDAYKDECDRWQMAGRAPEPPHAPYRRARATATLYVWNRMDEGNALARLKWTEDWLVSRRYLADDNPDVLTWVRIPRQVIDRKRRRVELTLEPARERAA